MKVNAISSNNYIPNRNINKNSNLSFGQITNMPMITARIEQDVKSGKVPRELADQTIEGLKKIKFSLADCLKRFAKTWEAPVTTDQWDNFRQIYNKFYLPLLEKNKLDQNDLPFRLTYSFGPFDPPECYRGPMDEGNWHYFTLTRNFNDIQYNEKEMMFVQPEDDKDKRVARASRKSDEYPTYTECLKSFIDKKDIEESFYYFYALPILKDITYCSYIPNSTIKGFPVRQTMPGPL